MTRLHREDQKAPEHAASERLTTSCLPSPLGLCSRARSPKIIALLLVESATSALMKDMPHSKALAGTDETQITTSPDIIADSADETFRRSIDGIEKSILSRDGRKDTRLRESLRPRRQQMRDSMPKELEKLYKGTDEGRMLEDDDGNEYQLGNNDAFAKDGSQGRM